MTTSLPVPVSDGLRRVPVQGRSVARVQRMLDACAELVDEVGYEGLTTTLLAERAGVAIGSVYQFFPDKRAVMQALTERSVQEYLRRLTGRCADPSLATWWDAVVASIDEYVDMHRTVPGFRALSLAAGGRREAGRDHHAAVTSRLAEVLVARFGVPDTPRLRFTIAIAVEAADALVKLAFRRSPDGDEAVLAEMRTLLSGYLHQQVGSRGAPAEP